MKKLLLILLLAVGTFSMLHDTTGIPVRIIRESELGIYDTTLDTVNTIFEYPTYFILDGCYYLKPKYRVEVINEQNRSRGANGND